MGGTTPTYNLSLGPLAIASNNSRMLPNMRFIPYIHHSFWDVFSKKSIFSGVFPPPPEECESLRRNWISWDLLGFKWGCH